MTTEKEQTVAEAHAQLGTVRPKTITMSADLYETRLMMARDSAWQELVQSFSPQQKSKLAMLMAHNWHIKAIALEHTNAQGLIETQIITVN